MDVKFDPLFLTVSGCNSIQFAVIRFDANGPFVRVVSSNTAEVQVGAAAAKAHV